MAAPLFLARDTFFPRSRCRASHGFASGFRAAISPSTVPLPFAQQAKAPQQNSAASADLHQRVGNKFVGRHIQVARSRALSDTAGSIIVRAVTGAKPSPVSASRIATSLA